MYIPYNNNLIINSRALRNHATKQENKLWYRFLNNFSVRFVRQKPIDNYIVDFYCPSKKLAIEIDGSQHYTEDGMQYDKIRTDILNQYGITVIRFTNEDVNKSFYEVCEYIETFVQDMPDKKQI